MGNRPSAGHPSFLIIAVISQKFGGNQSSTFVFILLLAAFGWMLTARVVRSMTLSVKNLEYVTAARYMSVPPRVIITKHIIPNVASYLIIDAALGFVNAVMSETVLSYFGFGVQPPETSLGVLIAEGQGMATPRRGSSWHHDGLDADTYFRELYR